MQQFEVNRSDFSETRVIELPPTSLDAGQVRLRVERFAFTTNNITYAVAGDMLDYWGFFPAPSPWGRIPAMGLGTVVESSHPDIARGGRYFGFYPMADEVVITAEPRSNGFRDAGAHRASHATTYTDFRNIEADATFQPDRADEYLLLWGMFMTSFLADDQLGDNDFHGASQTLVTSASSKTSICLAECLADRANHASVGVTSERNRAFVEGLELYDQVITYGDITSLDADVDSCLVDMAGNAQVRHDVHSHFGDRLRASLTVGATHWDADASTEPLPGVKPEFFFAPGQAAKRAGEWGPDELARRIAERFTRVVDHAHRWMSVEHHLGVESIPAVHQALLTGNASPANGAIVKLS